MDLEALVASRTAERDEMEKQLEAQARVLRAYKHHVEYTIRGMFENLQDECECGTCVLGRLLTTLGFTA